MTDGRYWTGLRPTTPSERAYIGVKTNNLFLNTAWHAGLDALLRLRPRLPTSSAAVSPQVDFRLHRHKRARKLVSLERQPDHHWFTPRRLG
jgi:hypothetical protein